MSAAAESYAQRVTHPRVKGATRALLLAIATHVPEGHTTTPTMTLDDLALTAQHTARTARTCRNLLEAIGLIRVHDGGRGNRARYELVHLAEGARPIVPAPLPLIGPAKPPQAKKQRTTSDLFSYVAADPRGSEMSKIGSFFLRWVQVLKVLKNVGNFFLRLAIRERRSADPISDVRTTTTTTRTTTAREAPPATPPPAESPPPIHPWHAWCAGRVHVPKSQHAEFLRRLGRRPGETDADLEARAFACYAAELATIPADQAIAVKSEFDFWRPRFAAMLTAAALSASSPPVPVAADDVWAAVLRTIEQSGDVNRHTFETWLLPLALVEDRDAAIVVAGPPAQGDLFVDYVEKRFGAVVHQAVAAVRPGARIEFVRQQRKSG